MNVSKGSYRILLVAIVVLFASCVDKSFRIEEVSKEVTLGNDTTITLPLGWLNEKSIEELLGDTEIPGLEIDENGNFLYSYEGEEGSTTIEGVSTEFEIPEIKSSFEVEYPEFNFEMASIVISDEEDISVISGLDSYITQGRIPQGVAMPAVKCQYTHVIDSDKLHIEFDVPEQISGVNKVIFRDIENGHHGAPMHLSVALNGLKDINAGGTLKFDLEIDGGTFRILDAQNSEICNGTHYADTYTIAEGVESVDFVIYIESVTNNKSLNDHHLDIPITLTYNMEFEMATKAGAFNFNDKPHIALNADFEYGDAEVAVDTNVDLVKCKVNGGDKIKIAGLPEELKSVSRVAIVQNDMSILDLYAHGMAWLGDLADDVEVQVTLPDFLTLRAVDGQAYSYMDGVLTTTIAELDKGVKVDIEALDFGADGLTPNEEGDIELLFEPTIVARFKDSSNVSVKQLEHDGDFTVTVGISESKLSIESLSGRVDYAYEVDESFALTGLEDIDVEIAGVGIKPVIEVNITHPLTMEAELSGVITPSAGGVELTDNAVAFDDVVLKPATYENGEIRPTDMTIIIAHDSLREQYSDDKYTFVACDVTKLLEGSLPDLINIKLKFGVDSTKEQTLYITDNFSVAYDYGVVIPIAVDESFEIRYSDEVAGLNSILSALAEYDISVGDVTVLAKVRNTTPLEFGAQVVLKDADGNTTEAQVIIPEGDKVLGSQDGVTAKESVVHLKLDLGEDGNLRKLCEVDIIAFDLVASSAAKEGSVALNNAQSVSAELQIQIDGGVTVDLDQFLKK